MKNLLIYLFICIFIPDFLYGSNLSEQQQIQELRNIHQSWSPELVDRYGSIEEDLKTGQLLYGISVQKYNNIIIGKDDGDSFNDQNEVVLLKSTDGKFIKAIFKPRANEHQAVEVGAYQISQKIGFNNVLPTISTSWKGKAGILSYYIDVDPRLNFWKNMETFEKDFKTKDPSTIIESQSLDNFYIFAQVFGMWDLKWRNILFVGDHQPYQIMTIDNESLITPVYLINNDYLYICWKEDRNYDSSPYQDLSFLERSEPQTLTPENINSYYETLKRFFINEDNVKNIKDEEEKKKKILENIRGCLWGQPSVSFYIGRKGLWMQLYNKDTSSHDLNIPKPVAKNISPYLYNALKSLDIAKIREFYQDTDPQKQIFPDIFYQAILERLNYVLKDINIISYDVE